MQNEQIKWKGNPMTKGKKKEKKELFPFISEYLGWNSTYLVYCIWSMEGYTFKLFNNIWHLNLLLNLERQNNHLHNLSLIFFHNKIYM